MGGRGSGGHNKRPFGQHRLEGTYRRDRHGPLDRGNLAVVPSPSSPPATHAREARRLLRGLSLASRRLGLALLTEYEGWAPGDLTLLRLTLEALDRAAACRKVISAEGLIPGKGKRAGAKVHPLLRVERQAMTFAASALRQLNLEGGK